MLVLSRKIGEQIRIGKDVVLEVLEINGKHVSLGFVAPRDVLILRAEVPPEDPNKGPEGPANTL
jgi:carbon storage regulator